MKLLTSLALFVASFCAAQESHLDLPYASVDGIELKLDLHTPMQTNAPVVLYVHGGAWRGGSKADVPVGGLRAHGFAIASADYRLSTQAKFPAQIHDLKAAVRYLRAKAALLKIDASRIAVIGSSAGGHLAALLGLTNGHAQLEGRVGEHLDQSSDVCGIVSFFGASNLETILAQSTPFGLNMREPALRLLLGDLPSEVPELARLASPIAHLDAQDPPLLMIHGDADPQMPPQQSRELAAACEAKKLRVQLIELPGAKHGGKEFYTAERLQGVAEFLQLTLRPRSSPAPR